jgi:hypothetical protein
MSYTVIAMGEDELGAVGEFAFIDTLQHFDTREAAETFGDNDGVGDRLDLDLYEGWLTKPNPAKLVATRFSGGKWEPVDR